MEAERLIAISRRDLASSADERDIMAAVWRAQRLAQAVGGLVALSGPRELRGEARALAETGGRGGGPAAPAERLTEVADLAAALAALGALLGDVGMALVGVACATDDEGLYWQTIEAIDAADEATERVAAMLRRLTVRDRARAPGPTEGDQRGIRPTDNHQDQGRHPVRERVQPQVPAQTHGGVQGQAPARPRGGVQGEAPAQDRGGVQGQAPAEDHGGVQGEASAQDHGRAREPGTEVVDDDPRPAHHPEARGAASGRLSEVSPVTAAPVPPADPRGEPVASAGKPVVGDEPRADRVNVGRPDADRPRADRVEAGGLRVDHPRVDRVEADEPRAERPGAERPRAERLRERGRAVPDRPIPAGADGGAPGPGESCEGADAADAAAH
ncbi:DUF6099 family protein [Streptomyces sp. CC228A]|uniref:DUF6099 family protein n=1 Tax=Streptomyces sp. CC228A TaxID=2898186 RepID=UPI0035A8DE74